MKLPEGKWKIPTIVGIAILSIAFFPIAIGLALMWLAKSKISQPAFRTISLVILGFFTIIFGISYVMAVVSPSTTTESDETQGTQIVETKKEEVNKEVDEKPKEEIKEESTKEEPQEDTTKETLGETTNQQPTNTNNTPPPPAPKPKPTPPPEPPQNNCDPYYPSVCIPPYPPDLDCGEISYKNFTVLSPDPHGFDRDNDGLGCET